MNQPNWIGPNKSVSAKTEEMKNQDMSKAYIMKEDIERGH
jgi:hypothetical protein